MAEVCCTVDYQRIKTMMDRARDAIKTGKVPDGLSSVLSDDPRIWPNEALCRKVDTGVEEATFPMLDGDFVVRSDEQAPPIYYGTGKAPQPLDLFLAGIGMCMTSIYGEGAADLGLTFDSIEIRVRGDLEMTGILDFDEKGYGSRPGYSKIAYTVKIESDESEERIRELIRRVERCCPAHNTVMHGTEGEFAYFLNDGQLVVDQNS